MPGETSSLTPEARSPTLRHRLEYALAWIFLKSIGALPRWLARAVGISLAWTVYLLHGKLRRVGKRNLELALPEKSRKERAKILRGVFTSLGRHLAEVCLYRRYTRGNVSRTVVHEGFENYERAMARGKGVLLLTAHLGAWELAGFAQSLYQYPLRVLARRLDNPYLDRVVQDYRTRHGNQTVDKDFARGLIAALRQGETVAVLMDTNVIASQGVFVDFFGMQACTGTGVARVALRTDAAVVPAFAIWDPGLGKYRLRFDPAAKLIRTGNTDADVLANTALLTKIIEDYVRRYPDQWLWVHRRWKTRPEGEAPLY